MLWNLPSMRSSFHHGDFCRLDEISEKANDALSDMDMTWQLAQHCRLVQWKNYGTFHKGLKDYMAEYRPSGGYEEFHSGLASFGDGISDL